MEVVVMLFLIVVAVIGVTVAVVFLLPDPDADRGADAGSKTVAEPSGTSTAPVPTTLEGVLVARLISAEITRDQYRVALAQLAARDEQRNPMVVPGIDRPDANA